MIEPYRLTCGRCGSTAVRRLTRRDGWYCSGCEESTPAVYDLKVETWRHVGRDTSGGNARVGV